MFGIIRHLVVKKGVLLVLSPNLLSFLGLPEHSNIFFSNLKSTLMFLFEDMVAYLIIIPIWRSYGMFNRDLLKIFQ